MLCCLPCTHTAHPCVCVARPPPRGWAGGHHSNMDAPTTHTWGLPWSAVAAALRATATRGCECGGRAQGTPHFRIRRCAPHRSGTSHSGQRHASPVWPTHHVRLHGKSLSGIKCGSKPGPPPMTLHTTCVPTICSIMRGTRRCTPHPHTNCECHATACAYLGGPPRLSRRVGCHRLCTSRTRHALMRSSTHGPHTTCTPRSQGVGVAQRLASHTPPTIEAARKATTTRLPRTAMRQPPL